MMTTTPQFSQSHHSTPLPAVAGNSLDFHENIDKAETCLVYRSIHLCVYIFYRYNMEVGYLK